MFNLAKSSLSILDIFLLAIIGIAIVLVIIYLIKNKGKSCSCANKNCSVCKHNKHKN